MTAAEWASQTTPFDLARDGIAALRLMLVIREFERRLPDFAKEGLIRGSTHPSVGMEAVAIGVSRVLRPTDKIASNHRGHAHCLAKGADPNRTLAEIFGRADGYCGGKGGSMHIGIAELGVLGTNGIVGAGIGLATGAALAAQAQGTDDVAVAYFGDGAANQGVLAEAFNLAAVWKLPVVFVCENNHFAQSATFEEMTAQPQLSRRGEAYGVPSVDVDGMDVAAMSDVTLVAVERARRGDGPSFIVADTYRFLGHMAGDSEIYRTREAVGLAWDRDPVALLRTRLTAAGIADDAVIQDIEAAANDVVDAAEAFAREAAWPEIESAFHDVSSERN